ncbi:MAG: hypothetical protein A2583_11035 [Bdellovibrionales bacterium RIFOXYD1_FULL_53_11]|nr:MAG: hypothetical protein A2583_11035 [Bdellovibrionales bacterium RIFOXYD1_FULL_53_11]
MKQHVAAAFFVLTALLPVAGAQSGAPALSRARAHQGVISTEEDHGDLTAEIRFGRALAARILGQYKLSADDKTGGYVSRVGAGLVAMSGRPEIRFHFGVIESNEINAYACPGGYVFITKGALSLMSGEAQLAGVISHEIAHINRKHVVRALKIHGGGGSFASGIAAMIGGTSDSSRVILGSLMDRGMDLLFKDGLSIADEFDSDADAQENMVAAGYSPAEYRRYLQKISDAGPGKTTSILSKTHPPLAGRIERLKQREGRLGENARN